MIHCSYVFVNRKKEISKKFFRRIFARQAVYSYGKIPQSRAKISVQAAEKRQNADPHQKISYFFEKYALCLLTNE